MAQKIWISYNTSQDLRDIEEYNWDHAKFIAGVQISSKDMSKLTNSEKSRKEADKKKKQEIKDRFYYKKIGIDIEEHNKLFVKTHTKTSDELDQEYKNWVNGKKDDHDMVIDQYKKRLIDQYEFQQKVYKEQRDLNQTPGVSGKEFKLIGYTPEQLKEMGLTISNRTNKVYEEDPGKEYIYNNWLKKEEQKQG
jgi:hypothetical protein